MSSPTRPILRSRPLRPLLLAAAATLGAGLLTACASDQSAADASSDGLTVVASTSVYADIARQVAGDRASGESVISDPTADPHSYEASPADAAEVATADLVVYNGAGYDPFVDMALENADEVPVVRAVDEFERATGQTIAGHAHGDHHGHGADDEHDHENSDGHSDRGETNEHVWFSLDTAAAVAERVADELSELDRAGAQEYHANAQRFTEALAPLGERLEQIHDLGHLPYAQTERVAGHLFDAAHMSDLTPRGFLAAIEDDTDPPAADLSTLLDLVSGQRVTFLAFNTQTATPVTSRVREAAENADVVVVDVAETLPEGTDYLTWITDIVDSVSDAVGAAPPADPAAPLPDGGR